MRDVLPYDGRLTKYGFCLMDGPVNDLVGIAAQEAAGCVMTIFTTGRGTPAGYYTPLLRVSSNSDLSARKTKWIDYGAGILMEGKSTEDAATELFDMIIQVASGRLQPCSEKTLAARWVSYGMVLRTKKDRHFRPMRPFATVTTVFDNLFKEN